MPSAWRPTRLTRRWKRHARSGRRTKDEKALDDDRRKADEERSINQQERKVSMGKTKADIEVTKKEARGMVQATA